jgi:diguanylate cyclase (GGDEF)-like protein
VIVSRTPRFLRRIAFAALVTGIVPRAVEAGARQSPDSLEAMLPELSGRVRVRALALLAEAYRSTAPERAVEFAREALSFAEVDPEPASEVRALNEMAWALMELGRYGEAMSRAALAQDLAGRTGQRRGLARSLNNQGVIERRLGGYGQALELHRRAMAIYQGLGDEAAIATCLDNVSVVLGFDLGDFDSALESQLQALAIREELGDPEALHESYQTLGVLYDNIGNHVEALRYLDRALEGWRALELRPRIAATLSSQASVYTQVGQLEEGLAAQLESLALSEALANSSGIAESLDNSGTILARLGRIGEARKRIERALTLREQLGEPKGIASSLVSLAAVDRMAREWDAGEARLQRALAIARDISALEVEGSAYQELTAIREARGDHQGALEAQRQSESVHNALFDQESARRIEALETEYQADVAQREIQRLRSEAQLASTTAQQRRTQWLIVILLLLVAFLLYRRHVMAGLRVNLEKLVAERTAELQSAIARLQSLSLTDPLTGLRNRRYLFQSVESDIAVTLRAYRDASRIRAPVPENADLVFYVLDLDDFKSVNDEFGHAAGDRVLEQVARILEETSRASDIVVRWGGEEFLVMSRQVDRRGAASYAERIRERIRGHVFVAGDGRVLRRTCSLGFAAFPFHPGDPEAVKWEVVLGLADQGAYAAKRSGRDAWVGLSYVPGTDPSTVTGESEVVCRLARQGRLEVSSSLFRDGRSVDWGARPTDDAQMAAGD